MQLRVGMPSVFCSTSLFHPPNLFQGVSVGLTGVDQGPEGARLDWEGLRQDGNPIPQSIVYVCV